jgi:multiple sugar transport system permease protein
VRAAEALPARPAAGQSAPRGSYLRGERTFVVVMLVPTFFFLVMFYLYPTLFNLVNSFTDLSLFGLRRGGKWIGVGNYIELVRSDGFRRVLFNTVIWLTIVGVTVRIVLGLLLALLLNSPVLEKYRLKTISRVLLLVPWATPPIVAIVAWRWLLNPQMGEINKLLMSLGLIERPIAFLAEAIWVWPALITIITWNTLPLVTLTFLASLQSLPRELIEAAEVDGASRWQRIRYVILPHLKPAIIIMVLMSTFWTFNNFVYVWLTTAAGPGLYTNVMATEVYIKAFVDGRLGYSSAVGIVMASIMTAFALLYLRFVAQREFKEVF